MKFVLVNDRAPRAPSRCAYRSSSIGIGYLRKLPSKMRYCDYACYRGEIVPVVSLRSMADLNARPIVFALSNSTSSRNARPRKNTSIQVGDHFSHVEVHLSRCGSMAKCSYRVRETTLIFSQESGVQLQAVRGALQMRCS